jgi:hypothetical protein
MAFIMTAPEMAFLLIALVMCLIVAVTWWIHGLLQPIAHRRTSRQSATKQ